MAYQPPDFEFQTDDPRVVSDVVAGRSPAGQGGLTFNDVVQFAGNVGAGAGNFMRGLRDPSAQGGGLLMSAGQMLGNLGRRLPAAYAAGRGDIMGSQAMMQSVQGQERAAAMANALAGLDPDNPEHLPEIAQVAMSFGDTGTALQIMSMIESGELARMKAQQDAMRPVNFTEGRDIVNKIFQPNHPDADEYGYVEVSRGPKSQQVFNLSGEMDKRRSEVYEEVKQQTGDTSLALSATSETPKAFKDHTTGLWVAGAEAERGKSRERQGYIESLHDFLGVMDEMQALGLDTSLTSEWWNRAKQGVGEGSGFFNRFNQIRQELLTQYVKARSGAQVSDREIQRYEAQFPKYRDLMVDGQLKEGAQAMINGLLSNGEAMVRSAHPHKTRDNASEIYYNKLGRRGYEGIPAAGIPDPREVLGDLSKRTAPPRPIDDLGREDRARVDEIGVAAIKSIRRKYSDERAAEILSNPLLVEVEIAKALREEGFDLDFTLGDFR